MNFAKIFRIAIIWNTSRGVLLKKKTFGHALSLTSQSYFLEYNWTAAFEVSIIHIFLRCFLSFNLFENWKTYYLKMIYSLTVFDFVDNLASLLRRIWLSLSFHIYCRFLLSAIIILNLFTKFILKMKSCWNLIHPLATYILA